MDSSPHAYIHTDSEVVDEIMQSLGRDDVNGVIEGATWLCGWWFAEMVGCVGRMIQFRNKHQLELIDDYRAFL